MTEVKKTVGNFSFKKYNKTICTTYVKLGTKTTDVIDQQRAGKEQETPRRQLSSGF